MPRKDTSKPGRDKELSVAESVTTPSAEGGESADAPDYGPKDESKDEILDDLDEIDGFFDKEDD